MLSNTTRRGFIKSGAVAAATVAAARSVRAFQGANDRVRLGFIGVGNRGGQLIEATKPHGDAEIVAVCDVFAPYREEWAAALGAGVTAHADFRELLDRDDIDAVVVATPDHWHAIQTIMACDAGKDVYVEKPLSLTHYEGQRMVAAARRNDSVVQVGLHRRASDLLGGLSGSIAAGDVGKVTVASAYRISNMSPSGIGRLQDSDPPEDLDWDMWLGPRPMRPFRENIAPYKFRWWQAYSSQLGNWGVHYFDMLRWLMAEDAPVSVSCHGGRFVVDDDRTIPDTCQATFEFASGRLLVFGQYEGSGNSIFARPSETELRGTLGTIYASTNSYEIVPERAGQFGDPAPLPEAGTQTSTQGDLTVANIRDFLDCIKSRERPKADVEIGHRSTTFSHLANIALATGSRVEWDSDAERALDNDAANALLHYEYRAPWELE